MKKNYSVGVVLATYNGINFLLPQLNSLLAQTRPIDQCVVSDDGSNDGSIDWVRNFIAQNNLQTSWKLLTHCGNKGCTKNFLHALEYINTDIVFFADQDDIWHPQKIAKMTKVFDDSLVQAVYCLENTIDENGIEIPAPINKWKNIRQKSNIQQISLTNKLHYARSTGHLLAFRRELIGEICAFSRLYQQPHDIPVGTVAAIHKGYFALNEILTSYRIHKNNISNPLLTPAASIKDFQRQITSRQMKYREMWGIKHLYWNKLSPQEQQQLDEAIELTKQSIIGLKTGKISKLLPLLFSRNQMMNRMLAVRNILAILWRKFQ